MTVNNLDSHMHYNYRIHTNFQGIICKFWGCHKFSIFVIIFLRITRFMKIHRFCEHSLTNVPQMLMTSPLLTSLITYFYISRTRSRNLRLAIHPLISGLMYQDCPQKIYHNLLLGPYRMDWKVVSLAGIFKTVSTVAAAKVKACHHLLQVSDSAIQMYPTLQSMQVKVLPIQFQGWKFCG